MIVLPDQKFNPNFQDIIDSNTKLAPGVAVSKFLGTKGNPCSLTTISKYQNDQTERQQLARNLYLHAELFRSVNGNTDIFKDVRLIVTEGVYRGGPIETVAGDNLTKQEGRLVVYKVVGEDGKIDYERTFDLAVFWKDYMNYDKLSLEYDTWNPNGVLNAQIAVETPKVSESFDVSFGGKVQTNFNGSLLSADELTEVLEDV